MVSVCNNHSFEELTVGQRISFEASFGGDALKQFAELSGDWNPLHVDVDYAERTPFRRRVVHGMLVSSLLSRVAGMYFPGRQSMLIHLENVTFHDPVFENEKLQCEAEIIEKHAAFRLLRIQAKVRGRFGKVKLSATVRALCRPSTIKKQLNLNTIEIMKPNLSNEVALITGASRGIGAAIAEALGACQAKVVLNYHQSDHLAQEVVQSIEKGGGRALAIKADVSQRSEVKAMLDQAKAKFGSPVTLLINNATAPVEDIKFLETPWDLIQRDLNVHVQGAYNCLQEVLPGMLERKFGRIVSILTTYLESVPPKGLSSYVVAKSGLMGLTRSIASEYGSSGITANMIAPGMVDTDLISAGSDAAKKSAARTSLGRLAEPSDIIGPVLFLLSPGSQYMNGTVLSVNGGGHF